MAPTATRPESRSIGVSPVPRLTPDAHTFSGSAVIFTGRARAAAGLDPTGAGPPVGDIADEPVAGESPFFEQPVVTAHESAAASIEISSAAALRIAAPSCLMAGNIPQR